MEICVNRFSPANVILLGTPRPTGAASTHFFMDFMEGNDTDVLDLHAFGDGSNYVFADGSARFIREQDYDPKLWLVNKDSGIPRP